MEKILVIEDEPDMVMGLKDNLEYEGYSVVTAADGVEGIEKAVAELPDLIVLDLMLPKKDGYDVRKELRSKGMDTPIIMLTAKSQEVDKVLGLELGADDYVTKPFSIREVLARIKAVLRRKGGRQQKLESYDFGNVHADFRKSCVTKGSELIELSHYENVPGNVVQQIIEQAKQAREAALATELVDDVRRLAPVGVDQAALDLQLRPVVAPPAAG